MAVEQKIYLKKLIELGLYIHKQTREGLIKDEKILELSKEITQLDLMQYREHNAKKPDQEDHICPGCSAKYEPDSLFCSQCGFTIALFYESHARCNHCGEFMGKDDAYCEACGYHRIVEAADEL